LSRINVVGPIPGKRSNPSASAEAERWNRLPHRGARFLRFVMKVKLSIRKNGANLYEGAHEIIDAESFGRAIADVWAQLQDQRLQRTTSIGALMEVLNDDMVDELNGAQIGLEKL
jgi:hypothetical protein